MPQPKHFFPELKSWFGGSGGGGGGSGWGSGQPHRRCKRAGFILTDGCRSTYYCFTADTRVQRSDGRQVRMDSLMVGDWVLSARNGSLAGHSQVEAWAHRMPQVEADFIRLELDNGNVLKLTDKHYIYRAAECSSTDGIDVPAALRSKQMVYAEEVVVGDCLFVVPKGFGQDMLTTSRVVGVSVVRERGIYSPLTSCGDIVVEGVLASTYTLVPTKVLQDGVLKVG